MFSNQIRVVRGSILCDPTQPNTTNNGAYRLVVTYFYTKNLSCTFSQTNILLMFVAVITHIKSVIMSFKYKLFKELFKMSSAAAQKASTKPP